MIIKVILKKCPFCEYNKTKVKSSINILKKLKKKSPTVQDINKEDLFHVHFVLRIFGFYIFKVSSNSEDSKNFSSYLNGNCGLMYIISYK